MPRDKANHMGLSHGIQVRIDWLSWDKCTKLTHNPSDLHSIMMTSWHGNVFRITGAFQKETTSDQCSPSYGSIMQSFDVFFFLVWTGFWRTKTTLQWPVIGDAMMFMLYAIFIESVNQPAIEFVAHHLRYCWMQLLIHTLKSKPAELVPAINSSPS